jgi:hypothetical protein
VGIKNLENRKWKKEDRIKRCMMGRTKYDKNKVF